MILGHNTMAADRAACLGARPDRPDEAEYLEFLTASCIFLLGMLAFLGYIYLVPRRERLTLLAGPVAPGGSNYGGQCPPYI
jgi:hypothetical protein